MVIIIVSISLAVVLAAAFLIVYYNVFYKKNHMNNLVVDLEREYSYYHGLLTSSCQNLISRIEVISHSNLIYADHHVNFLKRYRDILTKLDKFVEQDISDLNDAFISNNKKDFKILYEKALATLDKYKNAVNRLNDDIVNLLKPEEQIREKGLRVKERNNLNYKKYLSVLSQINLASASFEKIFNKIDSMFRKFENFVDGAQYAEAEEILKPIIEVNEKLGPLLDTLPSICATTEIELVNKTTKLREKYDETLAENIPLYNVANEQTFTNINNESATIRKLISNLKAQEAKERLTRLISYIDNVNSHIDLEIDSKNNYTNHYKEIYDYSDETLKRALKIHNEISKYQEYYVLSSKFINTDDNILSLANKVTDKKRKVDSHVNSGLKQPYSIIIQELNELKDATLETDNFIQDFESYILSLKDISEKSYSIVLDSAVPLKLIENRVKKLDLDNVELSKLQFKFDRAYILLNDIYSALKTKPIDINKVSTLVTEFKSIYDDVTTTGNKFIQAKEQCVVLFKKLNESRLGFQNVNDELKKAEELFAQGNFVGSLSILSSVSSRRTGIEFNN